VADGKRISRAKVVEYNVRFWPKADVSLTPPNVRFRGKADIAIGGVFSFRAFQHIGHRQTSGDHLIFRIIRRQPREGGRALKEAL
jgi:hypothetical protein